MGWEFNGFFITKQITNKEALIALCSVVKHPGSDQSTQEVGRNTRLRVMTPSALLSCSSRILRLYNGTEHSQGLFICLSGDIKL